MWALNRTICQPLSSNAHVPTCILQTEGNNQERQPHEKRERERERERERWRERVTQGSQAGDKSKEWQRHDGGLPFKPYRLLSSPKVPSRAWARGPETVATPAGALAHVPCCHTSLVPTLIKGFEGRQARGPRWPQSGLRLAPHAASRVMLVG